jgi:spermidine/putrescine transport system permease protein
VPAGQNVRVVGTAARARSLASAGIDRAAASTAALLAIPSLWVALFVVGPIVVLCAFSVGIFAQLGSQPNVGFVRWTEVIHDGLYLRLFWKSFLTALVIGIGCVLVAYPTGYFLAFGVRKRRYLLLLALLAPFWTSYVLRILAWRVVLGDGGLINTLAYAINLRPPGESAKF